MDDPENIMEFKDSLKRLIEDTGGVSSSNLRFLTAKIRNTIPEFSVRRLQLLIQGYPPTNEERRVLSDVLGAEDNTLMAISRLPDDQRPISLVQSVSRRIKSPVLAQEIISEIQELVRFRNDARAEEDWDRVVRDYLPIKQLEDELRLFGFAD